MTIIYPINGRNERLGGLFKHPKHLLLYKGVPAIYASIDYMREMYPEARIFILTGRKQVQDQLHLLGDYDIDYRYCKETNSQIDTLMLFPELYGKDEPVMVIDCDIIPLQINKPTENTVFLFENKEWLRQYSNYLVEDGKVIDCNEKGNYYPHAGAGIYFFKNAADFYNNAEGCKSISQVLAKLPFYADTTSQIFRFGTLNDIKNDQSLIDAIHG